MDNPLDLTGKLVLVTGASSGIGRAASILFDQLGARVILSGRRKEALDETRQMMGSSSSHIIAPFDLSDIDAIPAWMKAVCSGAGATLDGLVHSAGVGSTAPLRVISRRHIDEIMVPNLYAAFALMRGMSSKFVSSEWASVVMLSSIASIFGNPGLVVYSASKGALNAMILSATKELAARRIRVNALSPTYISGTNMTERGRNLGETVDTLISQHFLGLPSALDIATAAAFLLSNAARAITGANLVIDGGLLC